MRSPGKLSGMSDGTDTLNDAVELTQEAIKLDEN